MITTARLELTVKAADIEQRPPVDHLVCEGNLVGWIADVMTNRLALGPNHLAPHIWPVSVEYCAEKNQSRVGFSYLPPTAVAA